MLFRKAKPEDTAAIWKIIQQGIDRRKADGSTQWQDGYPNLLTIEEDILAENGYVLTIDTIIAGYFAAIKNNEPVYDHIVGKWLTDGEFLVVHRIAISDKFAGLGLGKSIFIEIESIARNRHLPSIKMDTNFDNYPMLYLLEKFDYQYCGEVFFRGSPRKAFEKIL